MIHIIYITLILNALITGTLIDSFKREFDSYKYYLVIIGTMLFALPTVLIIYLFSCWLKSWLGSIVYVGWINLGFVKVTQDQVEYSLEISNKKQKKEKLSVSDKIFIWGAKSISNYYYKNQHKTS